MPIPTHRLRCAVALALATLATSAPAAASDRLTPKEQQQLDKSLHGLVPGKPQSCVPLRPTGSLDRIGDSIFLLRVSPRLVYRNDVAGGCGSSGLGVTPVIESRSGQYCRGDWVTMVDLQSHIRQGSCVLGDFVPYRARK